MEKREINGKWVYIFDSHNIALEAWAELKANHHELNLITLDDHTDTNPAFWGEWFCSRLRTRRSA
jgi:arginase family enzyme